MKKTARTKQPAPQIKLPLSQRPKLCNECQYYLRGPAEGACRHPHRDKFGWQGPQLAFELRLPDDTCIDQRPRPDLHTVK